MNNFFKKTNVDLSKSGSVSLHNLSADCFASHVMFHILGKSNASGSFLFSIGSNLPNYDNWLPKTAIFHSDVDLAQTKILNPSSPRKLLNGEELFLNIITPFSGAFLADVYGFSLEVLP